MCPLDSETAEDKRARASAVRFLRYADVGSDEDLHDMAGFDYAKSKRQRDVERDERKLQQAQELLDDISGADPDNAVPYVTYKDDKNANIKKQARNMKSQGADNPDGLKDADKLLNSVKKQQKALAKDGDLELPEIGVPDRMKKDKKKNVPKAGKGNSKKAKNK